MDEIEKIQIVVNLIRMVILVTIFSIVFYFVPEKITISIIAGLAMYLAWK